MKIKIENLAIGAMLCVIAGAVVGLPKQTVWSVFAAVLFFVAGVLTFYRAKFHA
jgi:hypothetical protein